MSHIATVKTEIRDLKALAAACKELGLTFVENQKTCRFWNGKTEPCDHAITLPARKQAMDLGLKQTKTGFDLVGDAYLQRDDKGTCNYVFGRETNPLGKSFGALIQLYGVHKSTIEAQKRGYLVKRQILPGTQKIQLVVTGV